MGRIVLKKLTTNYLKMSKGKYIIIEGGDGSGKGRQIELLGEYLNTKEIPFIRTIEPGATEIGEIYRGIIKTERGEILTPQAELFTFLADRAQNIFHNVIPNLDEGRWVISDRGFPSTFAYQGFGLGIDLKFIDELNNFVMTFKGRLIQPDLTVIIELDPSLGLKKAVEEKGKERMEKKGLWFHKKVLEGYLQFANTHNNSVLIQYIDGNPEGTFGCIRKDLEMRFKI